MDLTDLFVYVTMLCLAPLFIVIFLCALVLMAPVLVPLEIAQWLGRRRS